MATLSHARTLYQRAQDTGDWERFNAYLSQLMKPPKPRATKRPRKRKEITPAPIMQTVFADGRVCRMSIAQFEGEPLPVEKAVRIAQGIYYDHICADVPETVSCERVNGQPRPDGCGLIRYQPNDQTIGLLRQWEADDGHWHDDFTAGWAITDPALDPWRDHSAPRYQNAAA